MSRPLSDYNEALDWEVLHTPKTIDGPFSSPTIISGTSKYILSRDDNYNIIGFIKGQSTTHEAKSVESNLMLNPRDLTINCQCVNYDLHNFNLERISHKPQSPYNTNTIYDFEAPFSAHGIKIQHPGSKQPCFSFREWYLNAPPNNHYLCQPVERKKTVIYEHKRCGKLPVADRYEIPIYGQTNLASLAIKGDTFNFLLERVPESFSPSWSEKLMVEYREEWGVIPDIDTRRCIAEILGYLLGRRLISIGTSALCREGYVTEAIAKSHLQPNIRQLCKTPPQYPIDLKESPELFETAFLKAFSAYQQKKEYLPISECLRRYWLALELPLGLNIVILSTTIEMLANAWFKSKESPSHGKYLPYEAYRELLNPEIEILASKLDQTDKGKVIKKRILSANQFGGNDKIYTFYEELGLDLSPDDKTILGRRNKYAHGGEIDIPEAQRYWSRYHALFNLILLRIFDLR